jgi:hypothetical protein
MLGQAFRNFAIDLLDDEHGINSQAWKTLAEMLEDNGHDDIVNLVHAIDGRFYLDHAAAAILREATPE